MLRAMPARAEPALYRSMRPRLASALTAQRRIEVFHILDLIQPHMLNATGDIRTLKHDLGIHALAIMRVAKHLKASPHLHDAGTGAAVAQAQNDVAMRRQSSDQRYQLFDISFRSAHARRSPGHMITLHLPAVSLACARSSMQFMALTDRRRRAPDLPA
jgi:hypothetical protein